MRSARLPGKPLADIAGAPRIVHVIRRAHAAAIGPVLVATDDAEIAWIIESEGTRAVMTRPDHLSGTDRVAEAVAQVDPHRSHEIVVNLQGDEPEIDPAALRAVLEPLDNAAADIATLAAPLADHERCDPNAVKLSGAPRGARLIEECRFTRNAAPETEGPPWRHIGVYAFRRAALQRFVALPPSANERREKLEQLRALDHGMRIDAALVDYAPRGVDTPADLAAVRERFAKGLIR